MKPQQTPDFLRKSSLALAIVCLVFLTPFAINNFIQGRLLLGTGSLALIAILIFNTWTITRYNRYYDSLTLLGLVPAILFFLVTSLRSQGIIGVLWCYPAAASFYLLLPERKAWIANVALLIVTLPVAWTVIEQVLAVRMMATLVMISIFLVIFVRVINEQQYKLKLQAATDPLTGLLNRTLLEETLEQATAQSHRTGVAMTLAALDIDHFKSINDTFGHAAGDQVLRRIGQLLQGRVRRVDKVFRLGGEELLVLLYGTGGKNGSSVAEELREAIAALELLPDRPVTVSIGLATLYPQENWKLWLKRSDENLYQAKAMGRNRVVT
ncbi:putative diguanylate cyclase AdrA [Acaryochloris thomasi RCC1774]|uniref:Putative diguanylate cyclase AdrA n=1 Tax=Acaryochloris thomasi RCC1774 TaxID=1764569 RepID=A0A2W1JLU3_9CYAN|nr:GGDEF domain-containing protein [Acaryochloris thomasi]PZD72425.1 putative diguanylate cyclase AdrA [Acaryochloris thomasi RCC1774]